VFPQYVDSLRNDPLRNWDAKILRKFTIHENLAFVVSMDMLNLTNHTQFGGPNLTVTSSASARSRRRATRAAFCSSPRDCSFKAGTAEAELKKEEGDRPVGGPLS